MAQVETALGPIDGSELGFTLSHEHVFTCNSADNHWYPWLYDFDASRRVILERLAAARAVGVQTLIDLTTPDLGRDSELVREMSEQSGMHVICATGMWRIAPMSFTNRDPDEIADIFVREIEVGIGDTGIKAGAIKVANDMEGVTEAYDSTIRGAARACKRTGTPISTHHWALLEVGRRQVEIFQEEGRADGSHSDRPLGRHGGRRLPRGSAEGGRVPLDGPLPGPPGAGELAGAQREREDADRARLGGQDHARPRRHDAAAARRPDRDRA